MYRLAGFITVFGFIFLISCEKCMECSYSYTTTDIIQTVNGEEEVVTSYPTNYIYINDTAFSSECIKGDDEFTIENMYIIKGDTTVLDNYVPTCVNL